jgi:hypothetical protein
MYLFCLHIEVIDDKLESDLIGQTDIFSDNWKESFPKHRPYSSCIDQESTYINNRLQEEREKDQGELHKREGELNVLSTLVDYRQHSLIISEISVNIYCQKRLEVSFE